MTSYTDKGEKPPVKYFAFDHIKFWVGNAKQAADWYCGRLGFDHMAYKGLETGSRDFAHHVIKQNDIVFEFISPYNPGNNDFGREYIQHGDGVKDIVLRVDDVRKVHELAVQAGAKSIRAPQELTDANGSVTVATIQTYGDTHHTFINRDAFKGTFLPGYKVINEKDPFTTLSPPVGLAFVDHVVGNQPDQEMVPVVEWYEKVLKFHRFWSVDDKLMHTEYSALRSIVVTDFDEKVKMPLNEPAAGKKKSQIQEYVDYYGGAGAQHIALNTSDILTAIKHLRARGVKFLTVPKTYYSSLREKLALSPVQVKESLDALEALDILVDYDDKGYLLQIFTQPVEDRPTLFYEIIQRNNHQGFGAGNFKALFEAIERAQGDRGNL